MSRMVVTTYNILTAFIIALGWLRDRICQAEYVTRLDRTLPWPAERQRLLDGDADQQQLGMICCDCGLTHLIMCGHSVTPVRPRFYRYAGRMGVDAWTEPRPDLGDDLYDFFPKRDAPEWDFYPFEPPHAVIHAEAEGGLP